MADECWILVADQSHGRLFSRRSDGRIDVLRDLINIEPHAADGADATEAAAFAELLAGILRSGRAEHRYRHLLLMCPPEFLEMVTAHMHAAVADAIVAKIPRETPFAHPVDLLDRLPGELFSRRGGLSPRRHFEGVR